MKIFIDPGHNYEGDDTGSAGNGLKEQNVTYEIAARLKPLLEALGHSVKMSRNKLTDCIGISRASSIIERAAMANKWGADLFISIHCNAYDGTAKGTETLIYSLSSNGSGVAAKVQQAVVNTLGTVNRGIKTRPDLGVLWRTNMPALLVETAFIDNAEDALLLKERTQDFANAICEGLTGQAAVKGETTMEQTTEQTMEQTMEQTVMELPKQVFVQEMNPSDFSLVVCDTNKRAVKRGRYFNAGFFTAEQAGNTIPVGNLVTGGKILAQAKDNPKWVNLSGRELTTIFTTQTGDCGIIRTDDMSKISAKEAVSGIPIIVGGRCISMDEIKAEGYFGNECYDTWHGFLGIRHGKLVYVAMKCGFSQMCWALVALGIYDAIKLDGGGSFILYDGKELAGTTENRRIHNIGVWG